MKLLFPLFAAAITAQVSAEVYFKEQFNDDVSIVVVCRSRPQSSTYLGRDVA